MYTMFTCPCLQARFQLEIVALLTIGYNFEGDNSIKTQRFFVLLAMSDGRMLSINTVPLLCSVIHLAYFFLVYYFSARNSSSGHSFWLFNVFYRVSQAHTHTHKSVLYASICVILRLMNNQPYLLPCKCLYMYSWIP